ncbi:hypothetical protein [Marinococcus halotolerans]|nr:hypothetical protein [Marinococcus halotolerans]
MSECLQGSFFHQAIPIGRFAVGHAAVVNKYRFMDLLSIVIN